MDPWPGAHPGDYFELCGYNRATKLFEEVPLTAEQILADAASLSVSDRLHVVQAIWDSLPENVLPTPNSEIKLEFDRRIENYRQNPDTGMTVDELRRQLDADQTE